MMFYLQGDTSLLVLDGVESVPESQLRPESHSGVGSVKTFFCIGRGDVKVTSRYASMVLHGEYVESKILCILVWKQSDSMYVCSLNQVAYSPVDKLSVHLNLENGSSVDVSDVTVKVSSLHSESAVLH